MKILNLSLKKDPFDVMVTGEKWIEYRTQSDWIMSRLINKDGTHKQYDAVKFTNGYGNDKPSFTAKYNGFTFSRNDRQKTYSNGLTVNVKFGMIEIMLGDILETKNINK